MFFTLATCLAIERFKAQQQMVFWEYELPIWSLLPPCPRADVLGGPLGFTVSWMNQLRDTDAHWGASTLQQSSCELCSSPLTPPGFFPCRLQQCFAILFEMMIYLCFSDVKFLFPIIPKVLYSIELFNRIKNLPGVICNSSNMETTQYPPGDEWINTMWQIRRMGCCSPTKGMKYRRVLQSGWALQTLYYIKEACTW